MQPGPLILQRDRARLEIDMQPGPSPLAGAPWAPPLSPRTSARWACAALATYECATMSRNLSLYDSGELALAAAQLGLGHPPGQPLHTLLGYLAARIAPTPLLGI